MKIISFRQTEPCGWCGAGTAALLRLAAVTAPCCGRPECLGGLKLLDEAAGAAALAAR